MPKRILVVEDDGAVADLIAATLRGRGYGVTVAASAEEGAAAARDSTPDMIFVSLLLQGGSNGLKVCKELHGVSGLNRVPVVMLISYAGELDPRHMTTIGVVGVLVKPLKEADIAAAVQRILGAAATTEEMEELDFGAEAGEPSGGQWPGGAHAADNAEAAPEIPEVPDFAARQSDTREPGGEVTAPGEDDLHLSYEIGEGDKGPSAVQPSVGDMPLAGPHEEGEVFDEFSQEKGPARGKKVLIGIAVVVMIAGAVFGGLQAKKYFFPAGKGIVQKSAAPAGQGPAAVKDNLPDSVRKEPAAVAGKEQASAPAEVAIEKKPEQAPAPLKPEAREGKKASAPLKQEKTAASGRHASQPKEKAAVARPAVSVQAGVFSDEKNAVALADRLKRKGFNAFVLKDNGGRAGKTVHRVLVGRFKDRRKAAVQVTALEKEGIKSIIYSSKK